MKATNDTGETVALAARLGERIWQSGYRYAKAGIMIVELVPKGTEQRALWNEVDRERRAKLGRVVDGLNAELGRGTVRILSTGPKSPAWQLRSAHRSPRWDELPTARAV